MGVTTEEEGVTVDDPIFQLRIKYFKDKAVFTQKIKLDDADLSTIKGSVEFMVCDDTRCLPPTIVDLKFDLNGSANNDSNELAAAITNEDSNIDDKGVNEFLYGMSSGEVENSGESCDDEEVLVTQKSTAGSGSLWSIFGLGFLGGVLALLTPCVFPMIPLTVSFFTKNGDANIHIMLIEMSFYIL